MHFVCGMPSEFVFAVVLPGVGISLLFGNIFLRIAKENLLYKKIEMM